MKAYENEEFELNTLNTVINKLEIEIDKQNIS